MRIVFRAFFSIFYGTLLAVTPLALHGQSLKIPAGTAFPVEIEKTLDVRKLHSGDAVGARTIQVVQLESGESLPRGARLVGHIVEAVPFVSVQNSYEAQRPSVLAISFDSVEFRHQLFAVKLQLRALADFYAAHYAATPQYDFEEDARGTVHLIGGVDFDPFTESIRDSKNKIIAVNRSNGVFGQLQAATYKQDEQQFSCTASEREQALGIFAPQACGIYGFDQLKLGAG